MKRKSLVDLALELEPKPEPECSECGGPEALEDGRCQECQDNDFCGDCGIELTKENSWSDVTCKQCAKLLGFMEDNDAPLREPLPLDPGVAPDMSVPAELEARTFTIKDGKADFKGAWQLNKILRTLHDEGLLYKPEK